MEKNGAGDLVLCDNKKKWGAGEKDAREVIPYEDRFHHMLILGPACSGKTAQAILSMVDQDIRNPEAGITVIGPRGDLARKAAIMAKEQGRPYLYFDPGVDNCPLFNPLAGDEAEVVENTVAAFLALSPDSPQYFKDLSEQVLRGALKVLKRLDRHEGVDGHYSTLIRLNRLLQNTSGEGKELVQKFARTPASTEEEAKENADIAIWFLNEYFLSRSKEYEDTSGIRAQVSNVATNSHLRRVLNPDTEKGERNQIDFDRCLAQGGVICVSTAQNLLRGLSRFLGCSILARLRSAVLRRPGNEDSLRPHFLYVDEFHNYSDPGFADMLIQGGAHRVASHLAVQARSLLDTGGQKNFAELVSVNAQNVVIFPGCSKDDAKYYSDISVNLSPTNIIFRPSDEIVYSIIREGSIQPLKVGMVKYLDPEYDGRLKRLAEEGIAPHELPHAVN